MEGYPHQYKHMYGDTLYFLNLLIYSFQALIHFVGAFLVIQRDSTVGIFIVDTSSGPVRKILHISQLSSATHMGTELVI